MRVAWRYRRDPVGLPGPPARLLLDAEHAVRGREGGRACAHDVRDLCARPNPLLGPLHVRPGARAVFFCFCVSICDGHRIASVFFFIFGFVVVVVVDVAFLGWSSVTATILTVPCEREREKERDGMPKFFAMPLKEQH